MHIKKLEIAGFKSFVDRTVIHFDHDVIGIVGPNGCGKSNIVDAIRWCMGEQSAKHLRGASMADVIFNGSESRAAAGLCEVTLTFDNTDAEYARTLPLEYQSWAEISVTRRLFRDGTSEYLINKTTVRLRDVTDLFLGTGVGTKAYSIVEQGRIGQIVSSRPEDRRRFIEEAAGITKYKARRKEAERKMELTRQNLLRINDIVGELDKNRASLKRQVGKAERYLEYRREYEDLALHEASHRLLEIIVLARVQGEARATAGEAADTFRARLAEDEAGLDAARDEARSVEEAADVASREAFAADNELATLRAELERGRDRLQHLRGRLEAGLDEQSTLENQLTACTAEVADLDAQLVELEAEVGAREADAQSEQAALDALRASEALADHEVLGVRREAAAKGAARAALGARLEALAARITELHARQERLTAEDEQLAAEVAELDARRSSLERSVADLAAGKVTTVAEREQLEAELAALRGQQLESERRADAAKNELGHKRSRLRALEEIHRRLEGVGTGARALLQSGSPGVLGLVADRIEAPAELTAALAGLLGQQLQSIVVDDPERGLALLDELRRSARGRATVVPARPRFVAGQRAALAELPGALGRLIDRLDFAAADEPLVRALVGEAVLCESAAAALAVARRTGSVAVALDGTVARADGALSGGKGDEVAASMVEQKRELRVLGEEVERLSDSTARLVGEHQALRARLSELGTALDQARQQAHQGELAHRSAEHELTRTAELHSRTVARRTRVAGELEQLVAAHLEAEERASQSRLETDDLDTAVFALTASLAAAESNAADWKERVTAQGALVTERRVRLAQVREQFGAARASRERLLATIADVNARAERVDADRTDAAEQFGLTAALLVQAREARIEVSARSRDAHRRLDQARDLQEKIRRALAVREVELKTLREELQGRDDQVRKADLGLQRLELERTHLLENIRQRFRGLHLPSVAGDYHRRPPPDDALQARIVELSGLIDRMGPVNLDARGEFEEAERRFTELNDQKVDVEKALEELERSIKHMDRESRRRFKETFEAVNELFRATFTRMFRGGKAELRLTDADDLLGSGVDIIAQPPGKNLGNIELMSGGEKALTAVSLIFAIFQYRPSPFCVLDEVDAPLDEANVTRYNEAIRSMTDRSQFILITHIKRTMQSVDVLYGVTMGEPGVSRLVSVKVNEHAAARSEQRSALGSEGAPPAASVA